MFALETQWTYASSFRPIQRLRIPFCMTLAIDQQAPL